MRFISQNPISLRHFTKNVEKYVSNLGYNISVDNMEIGFNPEFLKPVITAYKIKLNNSENQNNTLEKVEIGIDVSKLISFRPSFMIDLNLKDLSLDIDEIVTDSNSDSKEIGIKEIYGILHSKLRYLPISSVSFNNLSLRYNGVVSAISNLNLTIRPDLTLLIEDSNNIKALELKVKAEEDGSFLASGVIYDSSNISLRIFENEEKIELSWGIDRIDLKNLLLVWPSSMAVETKKWIEKSLKSGSLFNATGKYQKIDNQKPIISMNGSIKNASVLYLEKATSLDALNATITLADNTIVIDAISSQINQTPVENLKATITNIDNSYAELVLNGEIKGDLSPIVDIAMSHSQSRKLAIKDLKGYADAIIDLKIPLASDKKSNIHVEAKLSNVESSNIKDGHSIQKGEFLATYDDGEFKIDGSGVIDKIFPSKIVYIIPSNDQISSKTEISDTVSIKELKEIGLTAPSFIKKEIPFKYSEIESNGDVKRLIEIKIGDNIDFNNTYFSMFKLGNLKGLFSAELINNKDGTITLKDYSLKSPSLNSVGVIELNEDRSIRSINSNKTRFNDSNFTFSYNANELFRSIHIGGDRFDITNIALEKILKNASESKTQFKLSSSLRTVGMHNGLILTKPSVSIECTHTLCTSINFSGTFEDGKNFNIQYSYPDFSWYSGDAGKSLKALNLYTKMDRGLLSFKAKLDSKTGISKGVIDITDYHLTKSPMLSSILTITATTSASFKGIADTLGGKGIGFQKLHCNLIYGHNLLIMDECVQEGNIFNMTGSGTFNLASEYIDVRGVISPVNIINTISGKTPILKQLSGGKGGLIAMNYTLSGSINSDPKIMVNPLSILSPGFLRNFSNRKQLNKKF